MVTIKQVGVLIENDIIVGDTLIGKVRLCPEEHEIVQLNIWEPYQNKGYGTQVVRQLISEGYTRLWVNSDNLRAIHVYEKCGFVKGEINMFEMRVCNHGVD